MMMFGVHVHLLGLFRRAYFWVDTGTVGGEILAATAGRDTFMGGALLGDHLFSFARLDEDVKFFI